MAKNQTNVFCPDASFIHQAAVKGVDSSAAEQVDYVT
jgi:hypothetical protein